MGTETLIWYCKPPWKALWVGKAVDKSDDDDDEDRFHISHEEVYKMQ